MITVNFQGFREIVDDVGGVFMDVDHRYFNDNAGLGYGQTYDRIDLHPGYWAPDRRAGPRLRPLPAYGFRPVPKREAAGVRQGVQAAGVELHR